MTNSKKATMYARIQIHGENLINLFKLPTTTDPVKLCKALRRIEAKASRAAEDYCSGDLGTRGWEIAEANTLAKLDALLHFTAQGVPVFVNGDPRGYALKIRDGYMRDNDVKLYRDMGGYGVLAPDLTNN